MPVKLTAEWDMDAFGNSVLILRKKRGKIALSDISEFLMYERQLYGNFVLFVRSSESMMGGCGWFDDLNQPQGDAVELYEYQPEDGCPICGHLAPPEYCPHCGTLIAEEYGKSVWTRFGLREPPEDVPVLLDYDGGCDPVVARLKTHPADKSKVFVFGQYAEPVHSYLYWMPLPKRNTSSY